MVFRKKNKTKKQEERNRLARQYYGSDYNSLCSARKRNIDSIIDEQKSQKKAG